MKIKNLLPLLLLMIASFAAADAQTNNKSATNDWLQFRGPNGTGVAEGFVLPAEFGSAKNLAWKTPVPFARSSPVVTADRVFLTATEGDKLITLALDRKTGKVLWRRDVVRARHMPIYRANDGASPTPVSDGKNVFVFFAELGLISYGPDGKERWRVPLGPFNSFYGMGGSPVLAGNTLVMVCDQRSGSFIVAVDTRDGKVLWQKSRSNFEEYYASPVAADGKVFVISASGKVSVLKAGAQWDIIATNDLGEEVWATPAIAGGNLYIRTRNALYSFGESKQ